MRGLLGSAVKEGNLELVRELINKIQMPNSSDPSKPSRKILAGAALNVAITTGKEDIAKELLSASNLEFGLLDNFCEAAKAKELTGILQLMNERRDREEQERLSEAMSNMDVDPQ